MKTKKKVKQLRGKKLWRLAAMALKDLRAVEKSKKYVVNMNLWYAPSTIGHPCGVCYAGAVMAKTCGLALNDDYMGAFDDQTWRRFYALNSLRRGLVSLALSYLGTRRPVGLPASVYIEPYANSAKGFFADMEKLIAKLRKFNV